MTPSDRNLQSLNSLITYDIEELNLKRARELKRRVIIIYSLRRHFIPIENVKDKVWTRSREGTTYLNGAYDFLNVSHFIRV